MLKKEWRITRKKDFDRIFQSGRSCYAELLGVKSVPNNLTFNRMGIIINNKVSKLAVERNRIRRRLRAHMARLTPELRPGHDLVVVCNPKILAKDSAEIGKEFEFCLRKLRLL